MTDSTAAPPSIKEILAQAENPAFVRLATAKVLLRQDLVARHHELDVELAVAIARDATTNERDQAPAISQQLVELQDEMEAAKVEFRFRAIGKRAWADLLAKHPPTKVQVQQAKDNKTSAWDHNPETFPIAAIAASCIAPEGVDEDAVRRLEAVLTDSQFTVLWRAAVDANLGGVEVPKSLAAGAILRVSERSASSASAAAAPSPEASFSDE